MSWKVPLSDVRLLESDIEAVMDTLRGGWLTMGPRTQELEAAYASYTGTQFAVAVSSGTAAIHLSLLGAGVGPGDEVVVPAMTFVSDAHAPRWCGAEVVLADTRADGHPTLDPEALRASISDKTKAVLVSHLFGYVADLESVAKICAENDLALIEDVCDGAGAKHADGRSLGTTGVAGCFSFFSKTILGVGEGGIIVTDDQAFADRARLLRSHAMTSVTWDRHRGHAETYDITDLGFNYRIDEPRATLALQRLGRIDAELATLRGVVQGYRVRLADLDGVEVPFSDSEVELSGHFAFPILVADLETRERVRSRLKDQGIQTTCYPAIGMLTEYADAQGADACPNAEEFSDRHIALPLSAALDDELIDLVVSEVAAAL